MHLLDLYLCVFPRVGAHHLYSGVDPGSLGVHIHLCIRARNYVRKSAALACVLNLLMFIYVRVCVFLHSVEVESKLEHWHKYWA